MLGQPDHAHALLRGHNAEKMKVKDTLLLGITVYFYVISLAIKFSILLEFVHH
jgi:hypothetical protein